MSDKQLYEALDAATTALIGMHVATGRRSSAAEAAIACAQAALSLARGEKPGGGE